MVDLRRLRGLMGAAKTILADIDRNKELQQKIGLAGGTALLGQAAKQAFPSPLETAQAGLFKAYSKQLLGEEGEGVLPDMDVAGLNLKGLRLKAPAKLTPFQQQEQMQTKRFFESWLQGVPIPAQTKTGKPTPAPKTREEAHWGLMQMGEDPAQYDFSHLPAQEKFYRGKPAKWPGQRMLPGFGRRESFKPPIPARTPFAGQPIEDAQIIEEKFTPDIEKMIEDNMAAYNRPREEIINALKAKGIIR